MLKKLIPLAIVLIVSSAWANDDIVYNQKTLANGDIETTVVTTDGTKTVQVQHSDGSVDMHTSHTKKSQDKTH